MSTEQYVGQYVFTYCCETWKKPKQQKSRIQAIGIKYFRRARGVTKGDRVKNEQIRHDLGVYWSI